jgi:hypothetical protein
MIPNLPLTLFALYVRDVHLDTLRSHRAAHPGHAIWQAELYEVNTAPPRAFDGLELSLRGAGFEQVEYFVTALVRRARVLKALDALLRYAFLVDRELGTVAFVVGPGGEVLGLIARDADQAVSLSLERRGAGHPIVQGADPGRWLDVAHWPDAQAAPPNGHTRPARFASSHRPALADAGAAQIAPGRWRPGLGTSASDLAAFVWQRARAARAPAARIRHG